MEKAEVLSLLLIQNTRKQSDRFPPAEFDILSMGAVFLDTFFQLVLIIFLRCSKNDD